MQYIVAIALLLVPVISTSDERMGDVGAYVSAVWFAEEFNEHCPDTRIDVPVSEVELRTLLASTDGGNLVDRAAEEMHPSGLNARDNMKELARDSVADGCDSETASMMRARVIEALVVPELVQEYQAMIDDT